MASPYFDTLRMPDSEARVLEIGRRAGQARFGSDAYREVMGSPALMRAVGRYVAWEQEQAKAAQEAAQAAQAAREAANPLWAGDGSRPLGEAQRQAQAQAHDEDDFDWRDELEDRGAGMINSAVAGAATGALVGKFFGGVGAIPGALVGGAAGTLFAALRPDSDDDDDEDDDKGRGKDSDRDDDDEDGPMPRQGPRIVNTAPWRHYGQVPGSSHRSSRYRKRDN